MTRPQNLYIEDEPDYQVRIIWPNRTTFLKVRARQTWKRLSAIHHARYFALRNPSAQVFVEMCHEHAPT